MTNCSLSLKIKTYQPKLNTIPYENFVCILSYNECKNYLYFSKKRNNKSIHQIQSLNSDLKYKITVINIIEHSLIGISNLCIPYSLFQKTKPNNSIIYEKQIKLIIDSKTKSKFFGSLNNSKSIILNIYMEIFVISKPHINQNLKNNNLNNKKLKGCLSSRSKARNKSSGNNNNRNMKKYLSFSNKENNFQKKNFRNSSSVILDSTIKNISNSNISISPKKKSQIQLINKKIKTNIKSIIKNKNVRRICKSNTDLSNSCSFLSNTTNRKTQKSSSNKRIFLENSSALLNSKLKNFTILAKDFNKLRNKINKKKIIMLSNENALMKYNNKKQKLLSRNNLQKTLSDTLELGRVVFTQNTKNTQEIYDRVGSKSNLKNYNLPNLEMLKYANIDKIKKNGANCSDGISTVNDSKVDPPCKNKLNEIFIKNNENLTQDDLKNNLLKYLNFFSLVNTKIKKISEDKINKLIFNQEKFICSLSKTNRLDQKNKTYLTNLFLLNNIYTTTNNKVREPLINIKQKEFNIYKTIFKLSYNENDIENFLSDEKLNEDNILNILLVMIKNIINQYGNVTQIYHNKLDKKMKLINLLYKHKIEEKPENDKNVINLSQISKLNSSIKKIINSVYNTRNDYKFKVIREVDEEKEDSNSSTFVENKEKKYIKNYTKKYSIENKYIKLNEGELENDNEEIFFKKLKNEKPKHNSINVSKDSINSPKHF